LRHARALSVALAVATIHLAPRASAGDKQVCSDAYSQAQSLRDDHKLVKAREQLRVCARNKCPAFIAKDCATWLDQVEAALPSVVLEAKDGKGNDVSQVKVTMDGQPFADKLIGAAMPIDPGEHKFVFEAPGVPLAEKSFLIREGERARHLEVVLDPDRARGAPQPPAPGPSSSASAPPPEAPARRGSGQRTAALIVGAIGFAGLAAGTTLALVAKSTYDGAAGCNAGTCATQDGVNTTDQARLFGNLATAGFLVGVAGVAAGAILWFSAPKTQPGAVGLRLGAGTVRVEGEF
jgi:hypothetical protein